MEMDAVQAIKQKKQKEWVGAGGGAEGCGLNANTAGAWQDSRHHRLVRPQDESFFVGTYAEGPTTRKKVKENKHTSKVLLLLSSGTKNY